MKKAMKLNFMAVNWLRGLDLNQRPSGYEPELLDVFAIHFWRGSESVYEEAEFGSNIPMFTG
jgi:hypothetical protein